MRPLNRIPLLIATAWGGGPSQENESQHHYSLRRGKVSIYSYLYPNLFNATGKGNDGDGAEIELRSES